MPHHSLVPRPSMFFMCNVGRLGHKASYHIIASNFGEMAISWCSCSAISQAIVTFKDYIVYMMIYDLTTCVSLSSTSLYQ